MGLQWVLQLEMMSLVLLLLLLWESESHLVSQWEWISRALAIKEMFLDLMLYALDVMGLDIEEVDIVGFDVVEVDVVGFSVWVLWT
jgi:hypothetical protein